MRNLVILLLLNISILFAAASETVTYDLSKDKVLYTVGYAHLDTQWRWDYKTTIEQYIKNTLDDNFARIEKYPEYVFNFTGSRRYEMMKEYYPEKYEKVKEYIAKGRWFVSGSSVEECDVLVPSSEAIVRQILYGNDYFRKEFGKESVDFMLPDCFGFPAHLPSLWAHCGLKGFSTQKLGWGSAVGIPFEVGVWEGVDGKGVIAALNPGPYVSSVEQRLDIDQEWVNKVNITGEKSGVYVGYHYYGVGDTGGAPREKDVQKCVESLNNTDGQIKVVLASSDQMYKDITDDQKSKLPRYKGDMLITEHSTATLTSQAYMKRWNRKNEQLADSAERAALVANWLGGADYPLEKINRSWNRFLSSQMHDILPGTCIPKAYEYAWNDEIIALNGFAACLENSASAVSRALDTKTKGIPLVVYNPLEIAREDVVEAKVSFTGQSVKQVMVFDSKGPQVPSQVIANDGNDLKIIFSAKVPSVGFVVFDVRPSLEPCKLNTYLNVTDNTVENNCYKVTVNSAGDVSSVFDKKANKELLAGPARLEFLREVPIEYPAWNMYWKDRRMPVAGYVEGPAKIRIIEDGPVRVVLEIVREYADSIFTQQLRLSNGDAGSRVEFKTYIDWQAKGCCLKASFPLTVSNPNATYNLTMGTIERNTNHPKKFEVPSHEWFDLTDKDGSYGVSVLEDCKFGSDKPTDNTVRLTLLHTPVARSFTDQSTQDWGRHEFIYALYGHKDSCQQARSHWQGRRLNQPLVAFQVPTHKGRLGKVFSMVGLNTDQVCLQAMKKAENSDYTIIRLQELMGCDSQNVVVSFASKIADAYEVDGQERRIGDAFIKNGKLSVNMTKFSPRSFAVKLGKSPVQLSTPECESVALDYNADVVSFNADKKDGKLSDTGLTMPAELFPVEIVSEGIVFKMGPKADGQNNAV
ncbi:MAG TPA: glycoside hydrolase family 38 C-terminal domain-containing protein, partial [Sedimentisphaerales bacterium]|nr:glycoside hydrolase family 38 C-terminal domain-containing protein [Sedimentisphaerales bacterium]